jgi:hypothetical protein
VWPFRGYAGWWSRQNGTEQMVLAVESEMDKRVRKEIEPDFHAAHRQ